MFLLTGLIYFLYKVYHMIHKTHPRFETLQTDISVLEPLVDKLCNELGECQTNVRRLPAAYEELNGQHEMLCDSVESVELGSYSSRWIYLFRHAHSRAKSEVERGNLIASMTMGKQKYLSAIRQANRGVDFSGEDTDMLQGEGGESETAVNDPEVSVAPASDCSQVFETFQNELYEALMRRTNADVNDLQNLLMQLVSLLNTRQPLPRNLKIQYFFSAQLMANRQPETN
jgi:hypothetical protein